MFPISSNTDESSLLYVNDVFSTWLYTGNGSTQTITNGIDLAGKGGLVWVKSLSEIGNNALVTVPASYSTQSLVTNSSATPTGGNISSFNSNGFSLDYVYSGASYQNNPSTKFVSWTFRKAAKFFDVVTSTYVTGGITFNHSLGVAPGMVIIKDISITGNWLVYHRSVTGYLVLNQTSAAQALPLFSATNSTFTIGSGAFSNGSQIVAYLFAHDTSSTGIIQCGNYNRTSGVKSVVNLGWEPQFIIYKTQSGSSQWVMLDVMRSWTGASNSSLFCNLADAETQGNIGIMPTATGFEDYTTAGATDTIMYMAIRRPNKPPTTGTQVYNAIAYTGNAVDGRYISGVGFAPDAGLFSRKSGTGVNVHDMADRLRGKAYLLTHSTGVENTNLSAGGVASQDGYTISANGNSWSNENAVGYIANFFKRAPGFFDVVCYTGNSSASTNVNHNLTVAPEFVIIKRRDVAAAWAVYHKSSSNALQLNSTSDASFSYFNFSFTNTTFGVLSSVAVNTAGGTYVAYLFATLAGISKVGSYTGNGSTQNINCNFVAGARFVLIKRSDSTGDWYVWDTVRGIVGGNDPHLSLNTTAAEVTTDDSIDADNSGFIVNQLAATNINVTSATYIYLAIA